MLCKHDDIIIGSIRQLKYDDGANTLQLFSGRKNFIN